MPFERGVTDWHRKWFNRALRQAILFGLCQSEDLGVPIRWYGSIARMLPWRSITPLLPIRLTHQATRC